MIDSTRVMMRIGRINGRVTYLKRVTLPAPSIAVASCNSRGIVWSPASKVMAKNGMPRQVLTRITEKSARFGSTSHGEPLVAMPTLINIQFSTLKLGLRM